MNIIVQVRPVSLTKDYGVRTFHITNMDEYRHMPHMMNDNSEFAFAIVRVELGDRGVETTTTLHNAGTTAKRMVERTFILNGLDSLFK